LSETQNNDFTPAQEHEGATLESFATDDTDCTDFTDVALISKPVLVRAIRAKVLGWNRLGGLGHLTLADMAKSS